MFNIKETEVKLPLHDGDPNRKAMTYGAFALIFQYFEGQMKLLIKRRSLDAPSYKGAWDLPGGSLEQGESAIECLIREVKEETSLIITEAVQLADPLPFYIAGQQRLDLAQPFLYQAKGEAQLSDEAIEYKWIDLETALDWIKNPVYEGNVEEFDPNTTVTKHGFVNRGQKVGRTPRMVLDGLVVQTQKPSAQINYAHLPSNCGFTSGGNGSVIISRDIRHMVFTEREWQRLDPFSESGFVEDFPY